MSTEQPLNVEKTPKKPIYTNRWTTVGFICVAISTILLVAAFFSTHIQDIGWLLPELSTFFMFNYGIALLFFILRFVNRKQGDTHNYGLFLVLFSISAFSLNRELELFSNMAPWATIGLVLIHLPLLVSVYRFRLPTQLQWLFYLLSGFGALLSLYFTIYILPLIPIGVIGFFFFGFSLHALAPLLFFIEFTKYIVEALIGGRRIAQPKPRMAALGIAGFIAPLVAFSFFISQWEEALETVEQAQLAADNRANAQKAWITLAQQLPETPFIDKLVQIDLVYDAPNGYETLLGKASNSLSLSQYHDPLVVLAAVISGKPDFDQEDQASLIRHRGDLHHQSERQLWSSDNLHTSHIETRIELFPEYRMAYTEKEIRIKNTTQKQWRWTQEAIYTFHLPEGSAVTSLSLWVNGKEEKSLLTTKSRADSAYRRIVGVERRDPALLHWKEGNTITLRVFPCTPDEERRFKIGVTSPLQLVGKELLLSNTYFEGPKLKETEETTTVYLTSETGKALELSRQGHLVNTDKAGEYTYQGPYEPYWEIAVPVTPLSVQSFVFQGRSYQLAPIAYGAAPFPFEQIILDLNSSWNRPQFEAVYQLAKTKGFGVSAYLNGWVSISDSNKDEIFEAFQQLNFSLLPIGSIQEADNSLVVTKMSHRSPSLKEAAQAGMKQFFQHKTSPIATVNLGYTLSPYWKSLIEFGAINYYQTDMRGLEQLCQDRLFPEYIINNNTALLPLSGARIVETYDSLGESKAPDHLYRLFAYNKILQSVGAKYFIKADYISDPLIALAKEAHVVTPLSSLIVLETAEDYERFGIEKSKEGLGNAKLSNTGAVPEPHEWVLLCLGLVIIAWLFKKKYRLKVG